MVIYVSTRTLGDSDEDFSSVSADKLANGRPWYIVPLVVLFVFALTMIIIYAAYRYYLERVGYHINESAKSVTADLIHDEEMDDPTSLGSPDNGSKKPQWTSSKMELVKPRPQKNNYYVNVKTTLE